MCTHTTLCGSGVHVNMDRAVCNGVQLGFCGVTVLCGNPCCLSVVVHGHSCVCHKFRYTCCVPILDR